MAGAEIWFFAGRTNIVRDETIDWINKNVPVFEDFKLNINLTMRELNDFRADHILKKEWFDSMLVCDQERLVAVFEDRQRVVEMWRNSGKMCCQVVEGRF